MSERYTNLFSLEENLYSAGTPVIISAGRLLRDNQTGKVLAQIKLKNISKFVIKAVKISVLAFDVSGKEITGLPEYQYLDLSAERGIEFGQKQAVNLPDPVTRSIMVKCTSVIFSDGQIWNAPLSAEWKPLPNQKRLTDFLGEELAQQYKRDTNSQARYVPLDYQDLWLCACGEINNESQLSCCGCHEDKKNLLMALDADSLQEHKEQYDAEQKIKAEKADVQKKKQIKWSLL